MKNKHFRRFRNYLISFITIVLVSLGLFYIYTFNTHTVTMLYMLGMEIVLSVILGIMYLIYVYVGPLISMMGSYIKQKCFKRKEQVQLKEY